MDPFQNQNEEIEFGNLSEEDSTSYSLDEEKDKKTTPQKKDKNKVIEKSGVIYISHLPHGFYEVQLYKYFRQFGGVLHVKLARSKKSLKPKGFAFVEFEDQDVAKIAAKSMNDYFMFGRRLKCEFVGEPKPNQFNSKNKPKNLKNIFAIQTSQIIKERTLKRNNEINQSVVRKSVTERLEKLSNLEKVKREKLKELGIDYEWVGFTELLGKKSTNTKF
eukprot:TRINITY_DN2982_c0_g1_i2.p1 TRINITY_DN2982_c0_g1~~TRINITY_DN2982_c0_g1_i2.p1  ORF type:complete len:218 (-),score=61.73 TRINITY_DN2982_c0_g1_i2:40-693(-)